MTVIQIDLWRRAWRPPFLCYDAKNYEERLTLPPEPFPGRRRHKAWYTAVTGNWEWSKPNEELGTLHFIPMKDIYHLLTHDNIQTVELHNIAWLGKHHHPHNTGENCFCCVERPSLRYLNADITIPGIIVEGAPNPYGNRYRMIDGKHRIMQMLNRGIKSSQFYVLDCDEVEPFLTDPPWRPPFLLLK